MLRTARISKTDKMDSTHRRGTINRVSRASRIAGMRVRTNAAHLTMSLRDSNRIFFLPAGRPHV
jgi:hypothetical protein